MISVIVPVYNVDRYLKRCVDSILGQTYKNIELILVDDGSTDMSSNICDEYAAFDKRVIVIHKANGGQALARNLALDIAKGDYIGFVDSDDWIEAQMYESLMELMHKTNADIVVSGVNEIFLNKQSPTTSGDLSYMEFNQQEAFAALFTSENNVRFELWNKLFRKEVIGNERLKIGQLHEEVYFIRKTFSNAQKVVLQNGNFYNYIVEREGNTRSSFKNARLVIFPELNDFTAELRLRGYEDIAKQCEAYAMKMAIGLYYNAAEVGVDIKIYRRIKEAFEYYYKFSYLRSWKMVIFHFSPRLYMVLGKLSRVGVKY